MKKIKLSAPRPEHRYLFLKIWLLSEQDLVDRKVEKAAIDLLTQLDKLGYEIDDGYKVHECYACVYSSLLGAGRLWPELGDAFSHLNESDPSYLPLWVSIDARMHR